MYKFYRTFIIIVAMLLSCASLSYAKGQPENTTYFCVTDNFLDNFNTEYQAHYDYKTYCFQNGKIVLTLDGNHYTKNIIQIDLEDNVKAPTFFVADFGYTGVAMLQQNIPRSGIMNLSLGMLTSNKEVGLYMNQNGDGFRLGILRPKLNSTNDIIPFMDSDPDNETFGYIKFVRDKNGYVPEESNNKILIKPIFDYAGPFTEENVARVKQFGLYRFISTNMHYISEDSYKYAGDFSEGLANVLVYDENRGLYHFGYINADGKLVIPAQFTYATPFSGGIASVVLKDGSLNVINQEGKILSQEAFDKIEKPSEGMVAVQPKGSKLWGYLNNNGVMEIPAKYTYASPFKHGVATVGINGQYSIIDKNGETMFKLTKEQNSPDTQYTGFGKIIRKGSILWDNDGKKVEGKIYQSPNDGIAVLFHPKKQKSYYYEDLGIQSLYLYDRDGNLAISLESFCGLHVLANGDDVISIKGGLKKSDMCDLSKEMADRRQAYILQEQQENREACDSLSVGQAITMTKRYKETTGLIFRRTDTYSYQQQAIITNINKKRKDATVTLRIENTSDYDAPGPRVGEYITLSCKETAEYVM